VECDSGSFFLMFQRSVLHPYCLLSNDLEALRCYFQETGISTAIALETSDLNNN